MKLPKLQKPDSYVGLYVVDFGDNAGVGFTAQEVAELFESERFGHCKAYKIHKAYPDGKLELKGVRRDIFQLEAGMFFFSADSETARDDYKRLVKLGIETNVPCKAMVHLARYSDDKFAVAFIYPAEYDDEISSWLLEHEYKTSGTIEGGVSAVTRYYDAKPGILERHQLWGRSSVESRTGTELLASTKIAVQR
ncbi:MAG: hypothetical protein ABSG97_06770 [Sedimentisphaerales bacterium]|jgi:hypothetical protein